MLSKNGKRHRVQRKKYIPKEFTEFMSHMTEVENLLRSVMCQVFERKRDFSKL